MKSKTEKVNYFNREIITRHEKLQRAKELYIDFMDQDNHQNFSTYSPQANAFVMDLFKKHRPDEIKAFRKYVGIRKRKKKKDTITLIQQPIDKKKVNNLHAYAQLGLRFESKVKEVLLVLNHHKKIDFQVVIPVKGHGSNTSYLKPDIVINNDIWIDCKISINSNLKETALKYEGHCRLLEFYVLIDNGVGYGVDKKNSGQITRSIWSILDRGKGKMGEALTDHYYKEFKSLEQEYLSLQNKL